MRLGRPSRKQALLGAISIAIAAIGLVIVRGDPYPPGLRQYVQIIEANPGGGFANFRTDVTKQACPLFTQAGFAVASGNYGDSEVRSGANRVTLRVMRQFQFFRTLIIEWEADSCSAFVEAHYL